MPVGLVRDVRGTRFLINFEEKIIPIWRPRLREIIKIGVTPSVFVIETYILTL